MLRCAWNITQQSLVLLHSDSGLPLYFAHSQYFSCGFELRSTTGPLTYLVRRLAEAELLSRLKDNTVELTSARYRRLHGPILRNIRAVAAILEVQDTRYPHKECPLLDPQMPSQPWMYVKRFIRECGLLSFILYSEQILTSVHVSS